MTKTTEKGKFASKGKAILNKDKPTGLANFIGDKEKIVRKSVKPDERKPGKTETRTKKTEKTDKPKTVREEFRLPFDLAEKLRKYAFDNRTTKTAVVIEALEKFFD